MLIGQQLAGSELLKKKLEEKKNAKAKARSIGASATDIAKGSVTADQAIQRLDNKIEQKPKVQYPDIRQQALQGRKERIANAIKNRAERNGGDQGSAMMEVAIAEYEQGADPTMPQFSNAGAETPNFMDDMGLQTSVMERDLAEQEKKQATAELMGYAGKIKNKWDKQVKPNIDSMMNLAGDPKYMEWLSTLGLSGSTMTNLAQGRESYIQSYAEEMRQNFNNDLLWMENLEGIKKQAEADYMSKVKIVNSEIDRLKNDKSEIINKADDGQGNLILTMRDPVTGAVKTQTIEGGAGKAEMKTIQANNNVYQLDPNTGEAKMIIEGQQDNKLDIRSVGNQVYGIDPVTGETKLLAGEQEQEQSSIFGNVNVNNLQSKTKTGQGKVTYQSPNGVTLNYTGKLPVAQKEDGSFEFSKEHIERKNGNQCGGYVNDITGLGVGDSFESKKQYAQESEPIAGGIFVYPIKSGTYAPNGHIGMIESVFQDENGNRKVRTSEYNHDGKQEHANRTFTLKNGKWIDDATGQAKEMTFGAGVVADQQPQQQAGQGQYTGDTFYDGLMNDYASGKLDRDDIFKYVENEEDAKELIRRASLIEVADEGDNPEALERARAIMSPSSNVKLSDFTPTDKQEIIPILNRLKEEASQRNDFEGVMKASAGGKTPTQQFLTSMQKAGVVLNQLDTLNDKMLEGSIQDEEGNNIDLSPLSGWLAEKNPWDKDAQEIKAILKSTVPNLARGVYGEVGVLTDQDIENYIQTIPNLQQTDDVKKAVLAATLKTVKNSIESNIEINARAGYDMSGYADYYERIDGKVREMEKDLGIKRPEEEKQLQSDTDLLLGTTQPPATFDKEDQDEWDNL